MRNYNTLIDRYPGADGMKTGFICASGYNVVASATRNGRRLIAVVLGAYVRPVRAQKAAQLLERGFNSGGLSWLTPSLGTVDALAPIDAQPPNLREEMCGGHRRKPPSEDNEEERRGGRRGRQPAKPASRPGLHALEPEAGERQVRARPAGRDRGRRSSSSPARPTSPTRSPSRRPAPAPKKKNDRRRPRPSRQAAKRR